MPPIKPVFVMPKPPAVVLWRNAPGGESNYAIVTKYGKSAVSLLIFPSESRGGVPKDGVRFHLDPALKGQAFSDAGVWEYTPETQCLNMVHALLAELNARFDKFVAEQKPSK